MPAPGGKAALWRQKPRMSQGFAPGSPFRAIFDKSLTPAGTEKDSLMTLVMEN